MREGHGKIIDLNNKAGITPACAGRTAGGWSGRHCERDHPRVCGKDNKKAIDDVLKSGSPPRVREGPF